MYLLMLQTQKHIVGIIILLSAQNSFAPISLFCSILPSVLHLFMLRVFMISIYDYKPSNTLYGYSVTAFF